ncbi:MAG: hypothetical protein FJX03_06715 [Alphaproteobacteria bacterium]|nr:hypothetical protein [Alphaproteobacteria bacterium]
MSHCFIFLLLLFLNFNYICKGVEAEANEAESGQIYQQAYNPKSVWSDMHNLAQTRSQWFKDTIKILQDDSVISETRLTLAKKIIPNLNDNDVNLRAGLSATAQKKIRTAKIITAVLSDLTFSSLYWNFLDRVLAFYNTEPHNTVETWKALLPHLSYELANFDEFAVVDLQENPRSRYNSEEFFTNRAIFALCETLSLHLGNDHSIKFGKLIGIVDKNTKEEIDISDCKVEEVKGAEFENLVNASQRSAYYMEQLIYFRKSQPSDHLILDVTSPMAKAFEAYTLSISGPQAIKVLPKAAPQKQPQLKTNKKGSSKKKGVSQKSQRKASNKSKKQSKFPQNYEKVVESSTSSTSILDTEDTPATDDTSLSNDSEEPTEIAPAIPLPQPAAKQENPELKSEILNSRKPFIPREMNIREVRLNLQERTSSSYTYNGNTYAFPFRSESPFCFQLDFLRQIKAMTHLSPQTDKLPNIAQGALVLHFDKGKNEERVIIPLEELFLSGGKFFGAPDLKFKQENKIVTGMQDMLSPKERLEIHKLPFGKKSIPLGIALEQRIRREIIVGPWKNNCLDSEALLLCKLVRNLPPLLRQKALRGTQEPITITHAILCIDSYRDCCANCQKLIQGFQWRLHDLILGCNDPKISVVDDFGTLAIVRGHKRSEFIDDALPQYKGSISLEKGQHSLVCVPINK